MATSDILGLFTSPQQYQQNQLAQFQNRAAQEVQLSPFQQAALGARTAGYQLGQGVGGALGGVDPQLQKIAQRQQIIGMIDPSNPDSYVQAIEAALRGGDQEAAFLLRNEMMKAKEQAQQQEIRGFEREKFLLDRGEGMRTRTLQAEALEKAKSLITQNGTVDQTVYSDLINNYGQVGANVVKQRLEGVQSVKSMQAQQLAQGLFNANGTPNLEIIAELRKTPEGRKILEDNAPKTMSVKGDETIMTVPVLGEDSKVIKQGQKVEPFTGTMANAANFLYQTTDPKKIFATHGQKGLDAVDRKAEEMSTKEATAKAPKIVVDLKDPTAVAKASLDVMSKWEGFLKSSGDVENAVRYKGVLSSVALANAGNPSADSSLLYNIAKIYDNSGAVQEGDKKTIIGNPNIPTRFQLLVQGVLEGGSFTPKQREDLKNIATELVKNKQSQLNAYRKQYVKKNKEFGGDEMDILDPYAGLIKIDSSGAVEQIPTQRSGKSAKSWNDLN